MKSRAAPRLLSAGARVAGYEVGEATGEVGAHPLHGGRGPDGAEVMLRAVSASWWPPPPDGRGTRLRAAIAGYPRSAAPAVVPVLDLRLEGDQLLAAYAPRRAALGPLRLGTRDEGDLPPLGQVAAIGRDVARGLEWLHGQKIVLGEVRRDMIFAARGAGYELLDDFGPSRLVRIACAEKPEPYWPFGDVLVGDPRYLAPEAVTAGAIGPATDVFSLGCILRELLQGGARSTRSTRARAPRPRGMPAVRATPRVRAYRPAAPESMDGLIARMLERSPDAQPRTAEVAEALARLA